MTGDGNSFTSFDDIRDELADIINDGTVSFGHDRSRALGWMNGLIDLAEDAQRMGQAHGSRCHCDESIRLALVSIQAISNEQTDAYAVDDD